MHDTIQIGNNQIDKHEKYKKKYGKNDLYWGLGIENEVYLEFEKREDISKKVFLENHKSERYSVNYYENYKTDDLKNAFQYMCEKINDTLHIPLLLNANSFSKTDSNNNSKTLYTKKCEPNPEFNGKTLIEYLSENNKYFKETMNINWLFDGDTIEFTTNDFYNTRLSNIFNELSQTKNEFIQNLNKSFRELHIFEERGKIDFMKLNHPFAMYMTNLNNVAMFNNGTLHYNLTLPTNLDDLGNIMDKKKFINDHAKGIKIIQWMEPFLIGIYGSPDPFSVLNSLNNCNKFSKASQRCAISRYIGIGIYDTDKMEGGKILTTPIEKMEISNLEYWWYNKYYENNGYNKLKEIGYDINFNKHYNHGIEIRFLDHITEPKKIFESFEFIIYLMDYILDTEEHIHTFENPIKSNIWNNIVLNVIQYGKEYMLIDEEREVYEKIFNIKLKSSNVIDIYYEIYWNLIMKFNKIYLSTNSEKNIEDFLLMPIGKYSNLTLDIQNLNLKNILKKRINETINNQSDTIQTIPNQSLNTIFNHNKMNCCSIS
jgi:hypothetical protein